MGILCVEEKKIDEKIRKKKRIEEIVWMKKNKKKNKNKNKIEIKIEKCYYNIFTILS